MYFETVCMHQNMVLYANDIASCVFSVGENHDIKSK